MRKSLLIIYTNKAEKSTDMINILKIFITRFKQALTEKPGWGRNQLIKLVDKLYIDILTEEVERGACEKEKQRRNGQGAA